MTAFEDHPDELPPGFVERRQPSSPRHDIDVGYVRWIALIIAHRGKVIALAGFLGAVVTFLASTAAMRIITLDRLARVEQNAIVHDTAIATIRRQVAVAERDVATNRFLLCILAARIDPKRSEAMCEPILSQGAP